MRTQIHLSLSVEGALRAPAKFLKCFTDNQGREMTAKQVRAQLNLARFEGKKVIPMTPCDNFDYQTGCKGHVIEEHETI